MDQALAFPTLIGEDFYNYQSSSKSSSNYQSFVKQIKCIPELDHVVCSTERGDNFIYSIESHSQFLNKLEGNVNIEGDSCLIFLKNIKESGPSYEIDVLHDSSSGSFLFSTSKDQPVHMWDINKGTISTQFKCLNQVEELITPLSIRVNEQNKTLLTGHAKGIVKLFDIEASYDAPETCYLRKDKTRLKQPISSIDFSPKDSKFIALGCYDTKVYLLDQRVFSKPFSVLEDFTKSNVGVSQVQFSPDGRYLFVGTRREANSIYQFDIRQPREAFVTFRYSRNQQIQEPSLTKKQNSKEESIEFDQVSTNQKMQFDLSEDGKYLSCGNTDGSVTIYDIQIGEWVQTFPAMFDSVGAVKYCGEGIIATGSGKRSIQREGKQSNDQILEVDPGFQNGIRIWRQNY